MNYIYWKDNKTGKEIAHVDFEIGENFKEHACNLMLAQYASYKIIKELYQSGLYKGDATLKCVDNTTPIKDTKLWMGPRSIDKLLEIFNLWDKGEEVKPELYIKKLGK